MSFWQITLGDVIGYVLILLGLAITIKVSFKVKVKPLAFH